MVHVVIFQNTQKSGCIYRLVLNGMDITHQTPHQYVSIDGSKYAQREVYDWSTQGRFASELAFALDQQPFFLECHQERPVKHLGRPPRHQGYAYWVTPHAPPQIVYLSLITDLVSS